MRRVLVLFFLLLPFPVFSQSKHPFTFEDMMKLKRVGEPVPSPDGKWVLFSVVDVDLSTDKNTPHIWIVPLGPNADSPAVQQNSPANSAASLGMTGGERVL